MELLWPASLLLLSLIPILAAVYIWIQRRKRRFTVRYSSLALVRSALPRYANLRRHLPFALFLLALSSLIVAFARPVNIIRVPAGQSTVILSIDVSMSMRQTDIPPTRLEAAKAAALSFLQRQSANTEIGIVVFSGFAELIQPPTSDQETLRAAVRSLNYGRRTAIGSGIVEALEAMDDANPITVTGPGDSGLSGTPGAVTSDIIVLLTDGVSTSGIHPLDAAQIAAERGIRVYTIGFGTERGSDWFGNQFFGGRANDPDPQNQQGWGGGGRGRFRRGIDEATLKEIATVTGAEYFAAESADELINVFSNLTTHVVTREEKSEISFLFAAVGALFAALAVALALLWNPLP